MILRMRILSGSIVAAGALALMTACGGSDSPTAPSGGSGPGQSGATITIGANGAVSPSQVTISVGQSVTFINNDTRVHDMASNPHPAHTDCTSMAPVGNLSPSQTKLTNAFTAARTCGFHDHGNPSDAALQGNIIIQ